MFIQPIKKLLIVLLDGWDIVTRNSTGTKMANLSNGENLNNQLGSKIIDDYREKFLLGLVSI